MKRLPDYFLVILAVATPGCARSTTIRSRQWRLLTNWRYVLNQPATPEARTAAHAAAAAFLGSDIQDAIAAAETAIPDGEPLRQLILVQGSARCAGRGASTRVRVSRAHSP